MTTRARQRSFPSPPNRSLTAKEQPQFQALTPEMIVDEADDDVFGDKVAQEILRDNRLQKDKRKQKETKERLGSIQDRISRALSRYDLGDGEDFQLDRKKSEQAFDVFIVGFNESAEKKSQLLESLYNFFLIYEEDENLSSSPTPKFDLDSSFECAVGALQEANVSLAKLANIHGALMDGYSTKLKDKENKRKTKRLEVSFKEAQNELVALKDTLETSSRSLSEANTKAEGLRKTLEMKTSELEKNKLVIEKLRKQTENLLGVDERKLLKERTDFLTVLEKENAELKLHVGQLEFTVRKTNSKTVQDSHESSAAEDLIADLQNKMSEEREKAAERTAETLRIARAGLEDEFEETMERKNEEFEQQLGELQEKLVVQEETIEDLESRLSETTRPIVEPTPVPTPTPEPSPETVVPATISERTTSAVSVDPTEALNKKYKELEDEYEKKRIAVEEEMARNDEENSWKIEELTNELMQAKDEWLHEKTSLEDKVESFRKMVAEMESDALEQTHKLNEMLKKRDSGVLKEEVILDTPSLIGSQESEEEKDGGIEAVQVKVPGRPTTAYRNTLTPGPDNPVITQVITMYDHVTDFKEKLVEILVEIQGMGVIDETETMLMMRSLEQINTVDFAKDGNIHEQIEGIQNSIAQVMHSSEKTVHKIFKKLSKERGKIEQLTWSPVNRSPPKSRQRSVAQCDRATSPINKFKPFKPPAEPVQGKMRRPPAQYTAMFAFTDLEHNKRSLKQAVLNHKITPKQYEEVVAMMNDYTNIPQKRLQHLAKHYISHARMQIMEENIQMNRPVNEDIDDVLTRLDELFLLRKNRYGVEMDDLAVEREDLAYLLTKQLDRLEHQSGIFLIKPYIAYKAHTLNKNQTRKTPTFVQQTRPTEGSMDLENMEQPQDPDAGSTWSVGASRTAPLQDWTPDIPKLLEMDCNRITVARNTVSQPADSRNSSKTIKSFVVVRPSKSNGSFRPKSNATSTAEFLSINSDYKSEEISLTTSDNLPPLRSGYTSGFVSTSNSRQRLAPIVSPPSSIKVSKVEKVASVT
ncbi:girdin-like isoform X6 [Bolinopsis microptera]|uniref:girdin-like isoform X6 n=1 Tax=Bolinopsis microptera TaxID=2820187 RepID=UPI003078ACE1